MFIYYSFSNYKINFCIAILLISSLKKQNHKKLRMKCYYNNISLLLVGSCYEQDARK